MTAPSKPARRSKQWEPEWAPEYIAVSKARSTSAAVTARKLIDRGLIRSGARVLDIGSGHGRVCQLVVETVENLRLTAVDMSRELLRNFVVEPGTNGVTLQLIEANVDTDGLPFTDDTFDVVVSNRVFHYLSDPVAGLREAKRVAKPGGRIVVSVPNRLNPIKYLTYRRAALYAPSDVGGWFTACELGSVSVESMCFFPSARCCHRLASLAEMVSAVPLVGLLGGSVLVSGEKVD